MSYPVCAAKLQSWTSVSHLPRDVASQTPLGDRLFLQRGNTRSKRQHFNRADFLRPRQASMPLYVLHFSSAMPASSHVFMYEIVLVMLPHRSRARSARRTHSMHFPVSSPSLPYYVMMLRYQCSPIRIHGLGRR